MAEKISSSIHRDNWWKYFGPKKSQPKAYPAQTFSNWAFPVYASSELCKFFFEPAYKLCKGAQKAWSLSRELYSNKLYKIFWHSRNSWTLDNNSNLNEILRWRQQALSTRVTWPGPAVPLIHRQNCTTSSSPFVPFPSWASEQLCLQAFQRQIASYSLCQSVV